MYIYVEIVVLIAILFASIIPHEYAHKYVMKKYGIDSYFEMIDRYGENTNNILKVWAILVVPFDENKLFDLSTLKLTSVAVVGGIASAVFTIICSILLFSVLTEIAQIMLISFIVYDLLYAVWEVRNCLKEKNEVVYNESSKTMARIY